MRPDPTTLLDFEPARWSMQAYRARRTARRVSARVTLLATDPASRAHGSSARVRQWRVLECPRLASLAMW